MKTVVHILILAFLTYICICTTGQLTFNKTRELADLIRNLQISRIQVQNNYKFRWDSEHFQKRRNIKANVEMDFPELPDSKLIFDSPTYRVRVGRFTEKLDAERKFSEVREKYPNAMLLKQKKSSKWTIFFVGLNTSRSSFLKNIP